MTQICTAYGYNVAPCFDGSPSDFYIYCYEAICDPAWSPSCMQAWLDVYACLSGVACDELGTGCTVEVIAALNACP